MFNRKLKERISRLEVNSKELRSVIKSVCNHKFDYTISNQIRHVSPGLWEVKCCICGAYETLTAHELTSKQLIQRKEELKALEAKIKETEK